MRAPGIAVVVVLMAGVTMSAPVTGADAGFGDGTHVVGTDIQPGTYRSTGEGFCTWRRLRSLTSGEVIAFGQPEGPGVVTIAPTDAGFDTSGCGTWSSELTAVLEPGAPIPQGTFIVGTDIQPGTYRSISPEEDAGFCSWRRLSGFGGTLDEIVALDWPVGPALVTIAPTDAGFDTSGCGPWSNDVSPVLEPGAPIPPGTFIVGTDIQPGTYQTAGSSGDLCTWRRLRGFGGTSEEVIAIDLPPGAATVTIDPADVGFQTSGCADWSPIPG